MKTLVQFLTPFLISQMILPSAFAADAANHQMMAQLGHPLQITHEQLITILEDTVATFHKLHSTHEVLVKLQKDKNTSKTYLEYLAHLEKTSPETSGPLPEIKRNGSALEMTFEEATVTLKFVDFAHSRISINNLEIALEGLTPDQVFHQIQNALPKSHRAGFSLISRAYASGAIWVAAVIVVLALIYSHHITCESMEETKAFCDRAQISPLFTEPPKTRSQRKDLVDIQSNIQSLIPKAKSMFCPFCSEEKMEAVTCLQKLDTLAGNLLRSPSSTGEPADDHAVQAQ